MKCNVCAYLRKPGRAKEREWKGDGVGEGLVSYILERITKHIIHKRITKHIIHKCILNIKKNFAQSVIYL